MNNITNDFNQRIENNLNKTNRNIGFGLEKINLELFNISNNKDIKIKV